MNTWPLSSKPLWRKKDFKEMKKTNLASWSIFVVLVVALIFVFFLILSKPSDELDWLEKSNSPNEYFTAKEAYYVIRPAISTWNSDAVVTGISGSPWHGKEGVYLSPDGRMSFWSFHACSTAEKEWVNAVLIRGYIGVGWGERPGGERHGTCQAVPLDLIVDTDVVINTAQSRVNDLLPREIHLDGCDLKIPKESLCWNVVFEIPDSNSVQSVSFARIPVIINIFLGFNNKENLGKDWYLD